MTSGVLNCLTPSSAYYNIWCVFVIRILKGFCAGAMQPSMIQLLRHWVPPIERIHFMWAYCGITTGTCCTFLVCAAVQFYSRWPVGFYITGSLQVLWAILWIMLVTDQPRNHPYISKEEAAYLTNTIRTIFTIKISNAQTPWKLILTSVPFWALCILNFGYSWMMISFCLYGTLYYAVVIGYPIHSAAALMALPFFLRLVLGTIIIHVFHKYKNTPRLKPIKNIRKYFIFVSHVLPGLIVSSTWTFSRIIPGPIILTLALSLTAAGMDITFDYCQEMTPNFFTSVNTVIKIIGHTPGIIISFCVGRVTQTYYNKPLVWKNIWCFHFVVLLISGTVFLIWGTYGIQPWNYTSRSRLRPISIGNHRNLRRTPKMSNIIEVLDEDMSTSSTTNT